MSKTSNAKPFHPSSFIPHPSILWRRGWDLNPRWSFPHSGFRDRPVQPLQHLSGSNDAIFYYGDYSLGFSFSETELMQYLNPVGLGPSGKT